MFEKIAQSINFDDPLFDMATVLIAGIIGGEIFAKLRLPKVTGWIATGILLRWIALPGLDAGSLSRYAPFNYFVLGYIAFTVGATLYVANLRNTEKRIGLLLLGEATVTPLLVTLALFFIGPLLGNMNLQSALLLGAIAIAGAPGTTVLVIQESRAAGILTKTLVAASGLIDMVAVGVFVFVSTIIGDQLGLGHALTSVGIQFGVTCAIGTSCACIALFLTRTIVSPAFLGPTMVAVILAAWGAAAGLGTSGSILACTFAGIAVTNIRHDTVRSAEAYLHGIGGVLFALFFTFAGLNLDFSLVPAALGLVVLYFVARTLAKYLNAFATMSLAGATPNVRNYLGMALIPHGGVAVGLILLVKNDPQLQQYGDLVTTVGLATLAINQLVGPSAARFALTRAGEDHKDRPRLLDFLQEQRIVVGLTGSKREEVIRALSAHLYATTSLKIDQSDFVDLVLQREQAATTCLGEGLMIPHTMLDDAEEIKGVLGISSKGLHLGAPDGHPIHAVLLLATPSTEQRRHLEVLAAFATAITRDINLREQLYHARSAAHAYDVLHADDAEDLNYFLEDAREHFGMGTDQLEL